MTDRFRDRRSTSGGCDALTGDRVGPTGGGAVENYPATLPFGAGAEVELAPDVREFSSSGFGSVPEMYDLARQAAQDDLPAILSVVAQRRCLREATTSSAR